MNCFEARAGLWPPERPRLACEEVLRAREHVEACPECREYFAQDRALLEALDRCREVKAPRHVRERVFDVLARERAGVAEAHGAGGARGRVRGWKTPLAAAVLAAVLGAGVWTLAGPGAATPAEGAVFVEDYVRRAVSADHIDTADPAEVQRFLVRELGLALTPLQVEGLALQGAEICLLEGRRGAMIVYKHHGEVVSHYVVPREGARPRAPAEDIRLGGFGQGGEPAVVTWATPSLEQALVGHVAASSLMRMAKATSSME